MIYTIKPLEWELDRRGFLCSETMVCSYGINNKPPFVVELLLLGEGEEYFQADSVEHAKELAWHDWTKRLEGALVPCWFDTAEVRTVPIRISNPISADDKTLEQLERFFTDYTNDLNP